MRTFTLIWLGQLVSTVGTYMTEFALVLWAWNLTGSATALALVGFFTQLPQIPITFIAGMIVDRFSRKRLMMLGDAIAALSTIAIGGLYLTHSLQIWHLYLVAAVSGGFRRIQQLAYSTSIAMLVPRQQYTRANSMDAAVHYGSAIVAPALAGLLYPLIRLPGILLIDLFTFGVAIATLLAVHIPQPPPPTSLEGETLLAKLTFGFRTIWRYSHLRALLLMTALFWFFHDLGGAIYDPMILARTDGSAEVLASTSAAAGIGGVTGAVLLSFWGGPEEPRRGMLIGYIGAGLSKTMFGLGRSPRIWIPAQLCSSLNFPLLGSSETAIWMQQISPALQGRVFAANALVIQGVSAIATLIAGPLAEAIFEPLITTQAEPLLFLAQLFGSSSGTGIAVLYVLTSLGLITVGVIGYCWSALWQ